MKPILLTLLLALFAVSVLAISHQKQVIVSYPDDTPNHVINAAKKAITSAGGMITHEYKLIKAFAAKANAQAIDTVRTMGEKYNALVEDDQIMTTSGD